ncbi:MAG: PEGA domain-containing protein [Nitrospirae bacterium]|nr:PEGA domain-containing protein [Nitrospirota bacterium]
MIGKSGPETLNVRSNPEQAIVVITDEGGTKIFEGKTPTTVYLEKKKGYFRGKKYNVKIGKPGYAEQTVTVDTKLNGWYLGGNLIFGGLIGWLIVDPATGAMWTLDTNELNVTLEASKGSKLKDTFQLGVVLLEDVPQSLWNKLVKVSPQGR